MLILQRLGNILKVINDENVQSTSIALETSHQELYRSRRLTDQITITTKICPFADVNQKVTYKSCNEDEEKEYLVKSISHNIESGSTTWTLSRYYSLYLLPDELIESTDDTYFN